MEIADDSEISLIPGAHEVCAGIVIATDKW
jgi:hypothetical protein